MKRFVIMAIIMLTYGPASAWSYDEEDVVTVDQLQANPDNYLRTDIVVRRMACARDDDNEITCILPSAGKSLVIHAETTSYGTSTDTVIQLDTKCRGKASFTRKACIYDVRATPKEIRSKTISTGLMIMSFGYSLDLIPTKAVKKR